MELLLQLSGTESASELAADDKAFWFGCHLGKGVLSVGMDGSNFGAGALSLELGCS